jgi:alkanesulfonate monooxygenase SsuD/methylene tetrahydromethanopterin reductase-like flavin-dependent oxidoreductase (luciferase family)
MRVGVVILPEHRWWVAEPKWRAAETYGFDHAWTFDHLGWRTLVDGPWFGAIPTLTAAAMVTSRIRLGTWVASPNFRHPVPFARELTALDDISDGRFVLGVGAGAGGYDSTVMGGQPLPPAQQSARFAEFVELLDQLLTKDVTTWRGAHYAAEQARNAPGCVQKPRIPFVVAANGPKAMRLAARFGQGWVTTGRRAGDPSDQDMAGWWRTVAELSQRFDEARAAEGAGPSGVDKYLNLDAAPEFVLASVESCREVLGRAAELGFTDVTLPWPRHDGVFAGSEEILERVAAEVLPEIRTANGH